MKIRNKEYVKVSLLWVFGIFIFVLFTVLIASPFILWIMQPYRQLDIWVVDKLCRTRILESTRACFGC